MSFASTSVQRTHPRSSRGPLFIGILATLLAVGALLGSVGTTAAATTGHRPKVVVVVGATQDTTSRYRDLARSLADQARGFGARVKEIYSPDATWDRVRTAAEGANLFIYLGHGNGWPSEYAPFQTLTKDGLGLNAAPIGSDWNLAYYGEHYLESGLHLAKNAVVLLVHLCYASGNAEWRNEKPSLETAMHRVDNYGAGFLRTGARAVIAEGFGHAGYVLRGLFTSHKSLREIFWSSPLAKGTFKVKFQAARSPSWARGILDPFKPKHYFRSIIGDLKMRAGEWR